MKITDSEIIKNGEQELIDAITADLDWGAIEDIFREQHNLGVDEDVEYKQGDIVVHNDQIAYKLEFEVKVTVSVLLDREGNYVSVKFSGAHDKTQEESVDDLTADLLEEAGESGASPQELEMSSEEQSPGNAQESKLKDEDSERDIPEELDISQLLSADEGQEEKSAEMTPNGDVNKSEDGYEEALSELQSTTIPEDLDISSLVSPDEGSEEKISRMASQAGEIIEKIGN